jgi:hypothetical protein
MVEDSIGQRLVEQNHQGQATQEAVAPEKETIQHECVSLMIKLPGSVTVKFNLYSALFGFEQNTKEYNACVLWLIQTF